MDTFILIFVTNTYKVIEPSKFKDNFEPIDSSSYEQRQRFWTKHNGVRKYIQNPALALRQAGFVYPNIAIYERLRGQAYNCDLHVSISLAKLLYGHSFNEMFDEKLPEVIDLLKRRLYDMGIVVTDEAIKNAIVQTAHYSVNVLFPSEAEARMFLDRLNKCSLGDWFENNTKTFSNSGHAVRFHTDIFEIVFYLKYYDVLESSKQSIGRHKTPQEKEIAEKAKKERKIPALVRLEIRLNGKRSLRSHLKQVFGEDKKDWRLYELFSFAKCRKVLEYYWNKIINISENNLILSNWSNKDVCLMVINKFNNEKFRTVAEGLGMFFLLSFLGIKDLKAFMILRHDRQQWYRKRRLIAMFAKQFTKPNSKLIEVVSETIKKKDVQLQIDPFDK